MKSQFNDVFSLRKPKDARAGLSSGAKSIGKGVLAGVVGLVAAPVMMAREEGVKGFAKGVGAGVLGAAVLPVMGVGVGVTQMVRGVANTPEAIREAQRGKHWDTVRCLALVTDDEIFASVREQWHRSGGGAAGASGRVDYYALLGVERDAPPEAIKRAYYVLARKYHPDKNRGDPTANERFQQLGEAYQVLGNAELRARYDANGADGLNVDFMDSAEFFTALFGSDRFDHLVGELMIALAARSGGDFQPGQMKRLQAARQERLVVMLNALLRRYVEGDEQGFREAMVAEADSLAQTPFGPTMLRAIGGTYRSQAEIALGNFFEGSVAAMRSKGAAFKSQIHAAGLALKVYQTQQQIERLEKQHAQHQRESGAASFSSQQQHSSGDAQGAAGSSSKVSAEGESADHSSADAASAVGISMAAERAKLEEAALPLMLDAMWAANVLDIQHTVKAVCQEVLRSPASPKEVRRLRGLALKELGGIFLDAAAAHLEGPSRAKQQFEDAMQRMIDKRNAVDDAAYGQAPST
ncbi:DnaJ-domain-containing protein [Coccomyxa subellipsoidea C-169]|uniref:DnaJ-domain-containing protein n=1 Tax=Coccomyxa subellipsoidea (strain C-169) TaxID=574566 RepID=I0YIE4_COCSC|nr:DnaJ-domain-containing protein [Coccomyxa subellipsoidea C-169]EIE18163.1 DnaJ-domain-containing protein [Coccomyxa subellipsoidea C-169]|eukprot:XP_005642707.1 DnaJ-domain-containing protein [Coccomyxa subellipsoidea C-169]